LFIPAVRLGQNVTPMLAAGALYLALALWWKVPSGREIVSFVRARGKTALPHHP
jgi:hypothetical protein